MSFADIFRGARSLTQPAIADIETCWSQQEKAQASQMLALSIIGGPQTVQKGIGELLARTGADEVMIVSDLFDPAKRLRSFEIIAEVATIAGPGRPLSAG